MDANLLFSILGGTSFAAVLGAMVQGVVNRRKLGAQATDIITQAAGGLVQRLQDDNSRVRAEAESLREKVSEFEVTDRRRGAQDELMRRALRDQVDYAMGLAQLLREAGIVVPDPPTLLFQLVDDSA